MFAPTGDVNLYYTETGSGPPLIVHHGGPGSDHTIICPFLEPLADDLRLVCFDHRGTGRSSAPKDPGAYRFDDFVEDLEGLRRHLGLERFALLGHSFGGMVAQHYALAYPERLSHLVLVCTAAWHGFIEEGMSSLPGVLGPAVWRELEAITRRAPSAEDMKRSFLLQAPAFFRDPAQAAKIALDRVQWGAASLAAWLDMAKFDLRTRLSDLSIPTLVIAGRHDRGIPLHFSEELARLVPGARLAVSEMSGHFPYIEDAEWFMETVKGFVLDGVA